MTEGRPHEGASGAGDDPERTQALPVGGAWATSAEPDEADRRGATATEAPGDAVRGPHDAETGSADDVPQAEGPGAVDREDDDLARAEDSGSGLPRAGGLPRTEGLRPGSPSPTATARPAPPRPGGPERVRRATPGGPARQRRARLRLARIDPWSVLLLSLLVSLFLAVVVVVAVVALYAVLEAAGVPDSVNALVAEVTRTPGETEPEPLLSAGRALRAAGVIAVVDVVLLTALATLSAVLYNLCASFTGGLEVTLAEET